MPSQAYYLDDSVLCNSRLTDNGEVPQDHQWVAAREATYIAELVSYF